jgi:putative serine protease PepD
MARVLQKVREKVAKSVVAIEVVRDKDPDGRGGSGPSSTHQNYFNRPEGPCTGTIWSEDGYIVTSWFNVSGEVRRVTVRTHDGKTYEAKRLGYDATRDIALLKIEAKDLPVLPKSKLDEAKQGDFVAIVGRAPDPDVPTLNHGILSAVNRMKDVCVQTDAELNYGNVGGPLVTVRGEIVGITCQVKPRTNWGQSGGVGFACKHTEIDKALPSLKQNRSVERGKEPWLGITPAEGAEGVEGVVIAQVAAEGPGEEGGLQEADVITEIEGKRVKTWEELRAVLETKKVGDVVKLKILRKDKAGVAQPKDVKVKLGDNPN